MQELKDDLKRGAYLRKEAADNRAHAVVFRAEAAVLSSVRSPSYMSFMGAVNLS